MNSQRLQGGESPLDFPCTFPIKVMGYWAEDFDAFVVQIVRRHVADLGEGAVSTRDSRGGRYTAVTVTVEAQSQSQIDAIYRDLSGERRVVMVL
jgi:putative lipoic acid-binding regulatory protein